MESLLKRRAGFAADWLRDFAVAGTLRSISPASNLTWLLIRVQTSLDAIGTV